MLDFGIYMVVGILIVISWDINRISSHLKEIAKNTKKE